MENKQFKIITGGCGNGKTTYINNLIKEKDKNKIKIYRYTNIEIDKIYKISKLLINKIIIIDELIKIKEEEQYELYSLIKLLIFNNKKNISIIIGINESYNFIENLYEVFDIKKLVPRKNDILSYINKSINKELSEENINKLIKKSNNNFHILKNEIYKIDNEIEDNDKIIEELIIHLFNNNKDEYFNNIKKVYKSGIMLEDIFNKLSKIIIENYNCDVYKLKEIYITLLKYSFIMINGNDEYIHFKIMCNNFWKILYN